MTQKSEADKKAKHDDLRDTILGGLFVFTFFAIGIGGFFYFFIFSNGSSENVKSNSPSSSYTATADSIEELNDDIDKKYSELADAVVVMLGDFDAVCSQIYDDINNEVADYCLDAKQSGNYPSKLTSWRSYNIEFNDNLSTKDKLDYIATEANKRYDEVLNAAETNIGEMENFCSWLYDNVGGDISSGCDDASQLPGNYSKSPFSASDYYSN